MFRRLVLVLLVSTLSWPQTQSITVPTFRAKARLVTLDVVATNSKGEPIPDLKKEDFDVLEDGKPQAVSNFEEHRGAPTTQIKMPPMPPNVYTNFPLTKSADSVTILLLDALNTPTTDQSYVHSQMLKYLKAIPPGTRVGIFTLASRLRMLQGITTDSSELLAVLNNENARPRPSLQLPSTGETDSDQRRVDFLANEGAGPPSTNQTLAQAAVDPVNSAKQFLHDVAVFQTEARIGMTLQGLQQLARFLSGIPGRKNVIWFSGSFPAGIVPDPDVPDSFAAINDFQEDIRKTTDLLTAAQVAIYPIAAEGLVSDAAFQANGREIGEKRGSVAMQDTIQQSRNASMDRDLSHASMEELARDTGGQAFYNSNGLSDALARVVSHGTHYYSLAYIPTNTTMDGKFRRVQVKVLKGKATLAYRRGYYADDLDTALATGQRPDSDPLLQLMGRNLPDYTQILYKVLVEPSEPQPPAGAARAGSNTDLKGPVTRYRVDFAISVDDLKFETASDGSHHANVEVMLVAYDREGKPLNLVVTKGDLRVQAKEYAGAQRGGLQMHREIDVPAGDIYLRTGIYDFKSSIAGTLGVPLRLAGAPAK